jgi:hypothetical protein
MRPLWEKQIEEDLDWRMAELFALKLKVSGEKKGSIAYKSLLRALWAMMYAHYEGYCLFVIGVYLEQLEKLPHQRAEYHKDLVIFSLEKEFRIMRNQPGAGCYEFFVTEIEKLLKGAIKFEKNPKNDEYVLKGESNLYPDDIVDNCQAVCLPVPAAVGVHHTELGLIVKRRNAIAHGEKFIIEDLADYLPFESKAQEVMHELSLIIIDALSEKSFLRPIVEYVI